MKILAIDSTATSAAVAVCDDERLLAEYTLNNGNTHSETLLPMVETLLGSLELGVEDLDLFAVSEGPGSFTGVRIGVATIKGLAFGRSTPCVGVSTLEALAYNLISCGGLICPVMNARRAQVYTALFSSDGKTLTRLWEDRAMAISELDEALAELGQSVRFCGDGYEMTIPALKKTEALTVCERLRYQSGYSVAQIARNMAEQGEVLTDVTLAPTYLRLPQAERERLEKLKKQEQ